MTTPLTPEIVFLGKDFLIINKPAHWVCQAIKTEDSFYLGKWLLDQGITAPHLIDDGRVHRLDKMTTGLVIWSRSNVMKAKLQELFQHRLIIKKYHLLAIGKLPSDAVWRVNLPIARRQSRPTLMQITANGKQAITEFGLIKSLTSNLHYLQAQIFTGRTHQIRVHLAASGLKLLFDFDYHQVSKLEKELLQKLDYDSGTVIPQALHAHYLEFELENKKFVFNCKDSFLMADILKLFYNKVND